MNADELNNLVEQTNTQLLHLEHEKQIAQNKIKAVAVEVARLEGKIAGHYHNEGQFERTIIHLISQASCLVDAGLIGEAEKVFRDALDLTASPKLYTWIESQINRLSQNSSWSESMMSQIEELEHISQAQTRQIKSLESNSLYARRAINLHREVHSPSEKEKLDSIAKVISQVLKALPGAGVIIGHDLRIIHANRMVLRYVGRVSKRSGKLEFKDLPHVLRAKVFETLRAGTGVAPFEYEPEESPGTVLRVSVIPIKGVNLASPSTIGALLLVNKPTRIRRRRRIETEAAYLRGAAEIGKRFAYEISNAIVPLSVHQQLLATNYEKPDFRDSLNTALLDAVKRINQLVSALRSIPDKPSNR